MNKWELLKNALEIELLCLECLEIRRTKQLFLKAKINYLETVLSELRDLDGDIRRLELRMKYSRPDYETEEIAA